MWKFLNLLGLQWRSCKRVAHGAAFSLSVMQPDWNFYNNQVHNRPRDWRLSAIMGPNSGHHLINHTIPI